MTKTNKGTTVQISKGTTIFGEEDSVDAICVILRGRIMIQNEFVRSFAGTGSVIGVEDLFYGRYQADYIAVEDTVSLKISADSIDELTDICDDNPGYGGIIVSYLSKRIRGMYDIYSSVLDKIMEYCNYIDEVYEKYRKRCIDKSFTPEDLRIVELFNNVSMRVPYAGDIEYYCECADIPLDVAKKFFVSQIVYLKHIKEQQIILDDISEGCKSNVKYLEVIAGHLVKNHKSLYNIIIQEIDREKKTGIDDGYFSEIIDDLVRKISELDKLCTEVSGYDLNFDREFIKSEYKTVVSENGHADESILDKRMRSLRCSDEQIAAYAQADTGLEERFLDLISQFEKSNSKYSNDNESFSLRKEIEDVFYKMYSLIIRKALNDADVPYPVKLFLDYGYVSERLMSDKHLKQLIEFNDEVTLGGPCNVYTMSQWLGKIYNGERQPSKNDFDVDYNDYLREQYKGKIIDKEEALRMSENADLKLQYEIDNFMKLNHRKTSSSITTFVPILCSENCSLDLDKTRLTEYRINCVVKKINYIDYSLFAREVVYTNKEFGIVSERIIKQVYPDVILMPCYGNKGIMWQDIEGRKRDTPARFTLPAFSEIEDVPLILPLLGRFRWEICKTVQGIKWNDIHDRSLTSEYQDYIQFYRKNTELSEEWRSKIRNRIKSCHNNSREIFTRDYIEWITKESSGTMKLNKIVRVIMSTYCPFNKEIRAKLKSQVIYEDAMKKFYMDVDKKRRVYEGKCMKIEKAGLEVPKELIDTRDYFKL